MKIVGFQSGHDVSYAILENGIPVIHEELERFIRKKEPSGDGLKFFFEQYKNDDIHNFCLGNWGARMSEAKGYRHMESENKMKNLMKSGGGNFWEVGHHLSHAANAFFSSNFKKALIITIDGSGCEPHDYSSKKDTSDNYIKRDSSFKDVNVKRIATAFAIWDGDDIEIKNIKMFTNESYNIGAVWKKFVVEVFGLSGGYPIGDQSGTVMAMATVGNSERYYHLFDNINKINYKYLSMLSEKEKYDVAAALQKFTEEKVRKIIDGYVKDYDYLCFSGGVSLNCVMLGKMFDWYPHIKGIYCDPIPYDGGLALGCVRYVWHQVMRNPRIEWKDNSLTSIGGKYNKEQILKAIENLKDKIIVIDGDDDFILNEMEKQNIVAVYGGGSESGRRALGNRSILADPRNPKIKDIINEKVKHRKWFRPVAPSIMREKVNEWFDHDIDSPYMSFAIKVKEEKRKLVSGIVHFDGTARLQTVTEKDNHWYYNLIKKWDKRTGVPMLVNTSFNDSEPIVETPEHALNCFIKTKIDCLYFYDYNIIIIKNDEH